jgi:aspartokinase-like uncharacterized kinase
LFVCLFVFREVFEMNEVVINGEVFVLKSKTAGNRAVVVVDRGWIFAGDVRRENGRIYLSRAVHVFRWESIGFDGMIANPKSDKVTLKLLSNDVEIPAASEIFCIPVDEQWGL